MWNVWMQNTFQSPPLAPRGALRERVRPSMKSDVLDHIASSAPMAAKLGELRSGADVIFEHVVESARAFLDFVLSDPGRRILGDYGFLNP